MYTWMRDELEKIASNRYERHVFDPMGKFGDKVKTQLRKQRREAPISESTYDSKVSSKDAMKRGNSTWRWASDHPSVRRPWDADRHRKIMTQAMDANSHDMAFAARNGLGEKRTALSRFKSIGQKAGLAFKKTFL